ncbi:hypothetical protein PflCFBP13517_04400 [Pseudomonas fluorescens]|nr:hypothetical protein PflCFBP13517_04400 [Pseudomonas fluorescens]
MNLDVEELINASFIKRFRQRPRQTESTSRASRYSPPGIIESAVPQSELDVHERDKHGQRRRVTSLHEQR